MVPEVEVDHRSARVDEIARGARGATTCRISRDEQEGVLLWAGLKAASQRRPDHARLYVLVRSVPRAASSRSWARCA